MSKKINKTMQRKIATRAAIDKRRATKYGHDYSTSLEDDYYGTADHLYYEDVADLMCLPTRNIAKLK